MVEWLSQRVMHRPFVNDGSYISESTGLTFREQDEVAAKEKKKNASQRKKIMKIEDAIKVLKKAILSELNEQTKKLRKLHKQQTKLKNIVSEAADILHNIPHSESTKIDKEIEKAWDIMDKARYLI